MATRERSGRLRRHPVLLMAAGVVAAATLVLAVVGTRPARPTSVTIPTLAGTSLFAYGRADDPSTGPDSITYQPEGYTLFDPRGQVVAVALRCVGEGTVRISAGAPFDFRCTGVERTIARRDIGPRTQPFAIVGTTVGDVVWAARIVLLDPPQTAGAIPSFRDSCPSCIAIGEPS